MKNVLAAIGGFFAKLYKGVVSGADPTLITLPTNLDITPAEIDECLKAVNIIKDVVDNPVTVLITDLTPVTMVNSVRLAISDALPGIITGLTFAQNLVSGIPESTDQVNALLANVRLSDDASKNAFYHALAVRLIMIASSGKVTWSDGVGIIELYFKQVFGVTPSAAAAPIIADVQTAETTVAPMLAAVAAIDPVAAPIVKDVQTAENIGAPIFAAVSTPVALPPLNAAQVAAIVANASAAVTA